MRKFNKLNARAFHPMIAAQLPKAMKPLVFMYQETMRIFLGSRNVINLEYFWVFQKICCVPLGVMSNHS